MGERFRRWSLGGTPSYVIRHWETRYVLKDGTVNKEQQGGPTTIDWTHST